MSDINVKAKIKLSNFKIELHNKNGVYHPGQQVTGALIVHVEKPFETTGISLRFLGSCYVSNLKRHTHDNEHEYRQHYDSIKSKTLAASNKNTNIDSNISNKLYKDTEVYFDVLKRLWGKESTEEIDIGYHTIPFSLTLPGKLPTSLETECGYIRYTIMATIGRPRKYNIRTQKIITVISVVDLNTITDLMKYVSKEENANFGSTLFKKGRVNISLTINKSGFVPGEEVLFNATVLNATKKSVAQTAVAIICVITYRTNEFVKQETKEVYKRIRDAIPPNESDDWTNERMPIPYIPPSGFGESSLINPEYCVVFTCKSGYGDIEIALPIVIGTIPLQNNFATFRSEESPPSTSNVTNINLNKEISYDRVRNEEHAAKQTNYKKSTKIAATVDKKKVSNKTAQDYCEKTPAIEAFNMLVKQPKSEKMPPSYEDSVYPMVKSK